VVAVGAATTWTALLGLGFLAPAAPALRTVLGRATGSALVPVLQQTGGAELAWAALVSVGLLL
jgi:1,4-dihydroxy-2-naphthoate polyprenyltransferase